jgi:hypothetical protein
VTDWVTTPVASAWEWIKTSFQAALDWVANKWAEFKASLGLGPAAPAPAGATGGSFASGGLLGGRGTGTSDSNLAWVSRGEYITPARAVRQPGVLAFLEALRRSGGDLRKVLAMLGGFASGGLVGIPRYAEGGLSQAQASTFGQALNAFKSLMEQTVNDIVRVMQSLADKTVRIMDDMASMNNETQQSMSDIARKLFNTTQQIINDATGGTGRIDPSFAHGGLLGGRGTGRQPGVLVFLEALRRSGGNLRAVLDGMGRFALGGLVHPGPIPAFAGGGHMNNVTIQFPGVPPIGGLRASSQVVEEVRKAAVLAQVRSGGRKPSRYG